MTIHRRQFMQTSLGAAAAMSLAGRSIAAVNADDIRVAQIGFNAQGSGHINTLGKHIVALCDVDEVVLNRKADELKTKHQQSVDKYTDYRKLLERKDIDAVSIATPNHTHSLIAIAAAAAGKDVYVEKPVSHNIWEGRQLAAAARRYGRIIQTGTQSRSSPSLQDAVAFVQSGKLGAIRYAVGTCYKTREAIGKLDKPLVIPESIDYDLWCGPAEKRELFRPKLHYDWHWDFNTGCGDLGNQGIHQMDIARWYTGEDRLSPRVFSVGGRLGYVDDAETPNTQIVYHDYEKVPLIFEVRGLPEKTGSKNMDKYKGGSVAVIIECEGGYVTVPNYTSATAYDKDGKEIKKWSGTTDHFDNFIQCVKSRKASELNADIWEGHLSSALCHTGNISYRLGQKTSPDELKEAIKGSPDAVPTFERMAEHLAANGVDINKDKLTIGPVLTMDPKTEKFVGNAEADKLLTREYRAPYVVPERV
jgi:predicted dehydrogenase